MVKSTAGTELMNQISTGELKYKQSEIAKEVKERVSQELEELIMHGARVRPLKLNGKRVGWIRPLYYSERKILDRQIEDNEERIALTLRYCTTLTEDQIYDLDIYELNSILNLIHLANLADYSLFPYLSAFVTTQISQNLWTSRHDRMYDRKDLTLPDGKVLRFMAQSDHIGLWTSLSTIRDQSIRKLEDALNFGVLVKAQVGKGADKYLSDLTRSLSSFQPDQIEPWTEIVDFSRLEQDIHYDDGFGHSHQDSTVQGLMREMKGMMDGDRHEQLMDTFYDNQIKAAKKKEEEVLKIVEKRRYEMEQMEDSGSMVILTEAEVRRREKELRTSSPQALLQRQLKQELEGQIDSEDIDESRITKYFSNS